MIDVAKTSQKLMSVILNRFDSIKACADYLGITVNAVYRWIEGLALPSIDNLARIADAAGCKIDDLIVRVEHE